MGDALVVNRQLFRTGSQPVHGNLCPVAVHIGKEIERVLAESGMSKKAFAEKVGRNRTRIGDVFSSQSIDTHVLLKIGDVLHHDFFQYFRKKEYAEGGATSTVAEPHATMSSQPPLQLLVNLDPKDRDLEKKVRQLVHILKP